MRPSPRGVHELIRAEIGAHGGVSGYCAHAVGFGRATWTIWMSKHSEARSTG